MIAFALRLLGGTASLLGVNIASLTLILGILGGGTAVAIPAFKLGGWFGEARGQAEANARCEAAALRAQLVAKQRDLQIAQDAARRAAENAALNAQAAEAAQTRIREYEDAARALPQADCRRASDDDVRRLSGNRRPTANRAKPAAR